MQNHKKLEKIKELFKSEAAIELSRLAEELLGSHTDDGSRNWLSLNLAAMASEKEDLHKRRPLITALAALDEKQQPFHIEYCSDREEIAEELGKAAKWPELLSLLRSSLLRWQPDTDSPVNLIWLTKCFNKAKSDCRSLKAELNLKLPGGGTLQTQSQSYMHILLAETLASEAAAWHRALRGPGGVNFCLENAWVFNEDDFADEFMGLLAQDPVAYIALVNEAAESGEDLHNILKPENLLQGVLASEYCLTNLLKECLAAASGSARSLNNVNLALAAVRERLLPLLKDPTG